MPVVVVIAAISQVFPFGGVGLVDMVRKVLDLIRSIFWVDISLLIHSQWRQIYWRNEILVSSFLPFFLPRARRFLRFGGSVAEDTVQKIFIFSHRLSAKKFRKTEECFYIF